VPGPLLSAVLPGRHRQSPGAVSHKPATPFREASLNDLRDASGLTPAHPNKMERLPTTPKHV
jgi:hypothetical protein